MSLYSSCPVCAYPVTSDERRCPCCAWQLESDCTLGRLTSAIQQQYEDELQRAQHRWRKSQQQHAVERALAAAQARLRHVQRACTEARTVARTTQTISQPTVFTDNLDPSLSRPSTVDHSSSSLPLGTQPSRSWLKRWWWSLFQPERLAEYRRQREGR